MATVEEAVIARLLADAGVTTLAGSRIWPAGTAQATAQTQAQAYVTVERISGAPVYDHDGESGLQRARLELRAHAPTYGQAKGLAEALRACLSGWSGAQSGVAVGHCLLVASEDGYDPELRRQVMTSDFELMYA